MYRTLFILFLSMTTFLFSCNKGKKAEQKKVTLSGNIENYNGSNADLYLLIKQPGYDDVRQSLKIDSNGYFSFNFKTFTSLDAMLLDKKTFANLNFIYHPNDSIHIQLTANKKQIPLMESARFSGDGSETNNQIIQFQVAREKHNLGYGAVDTKTAYKLGERDYLKVLNEVKDKQLALADSFINTRSVTEEAREWIKNFATQTYYYYMGDYSYDNEVSESYHHYDPDISSFSKNDLTSWYIIKNRVNNYFSYILTPMMIKEFSPIMTDIEKGKVNTDSLIIDFLYKNSDNNLLNQLIIADYFSTQLKKRILTGYEQNEQLLKSKLVEPFVFNALADNYKKTYNQINNPQGLTKMVLKKIENTPIEETVNKILNENNGEVIYLDCWATWCGPCRKEMPYSKKLMGRFKNKNVSFVYVCIDSEEKIWKSFLSNFQLNGGQHYFLNSEQSKYFRNAMNVQGIPCYFLIDKEGNIIEQGSHLRPSDKQTEIKINELLEKG